MVISVHLLGLAIGLADTAGGVEGAGDFRLAEAGLAGGRGERAQIGGGIGVERAVGGPVQTGVAVAFGLAGDPVGQLAEPAVSGVAGRRVFVVSLGISGER